VPVLQPSASTHLCSPQTKIKRNPTKEALEKPIFEALSQTTQDPNADDYDKYSPWQRNEETATKTKMRPAVAKIEAEAEKKS